MSVVLGFLLPLGEFSSIITAVVYFAGIMAVLWPLQYLSAKAFAKQLDFDAMVAFDEDTITINHNNKDLVETKDWTWVKDIELGKDTIWLTINQPRPFAISIPRSELTEADYVFFEGKKQML